MRGDRSTAEDTAPLNGYSIIQVEDTDQALERVRDHPLLMAGGAYRIELFELPAK